MHAFSLHTYVHTYIHTLHQLAELQEQTNTYARDLRMVRSKIASIQRETRVNRVTNDQIRPLPEETPMYRSVGKAFIFAGKTEVMMKNNTLYISISTYIDDVDSCSQYNELWRKAITLYTNIQRFSYNIHAYEYMYVCMYVCTWCYSNSYCYSYCIYVCMYVCMYSYMIIGSAVLYYHFMQRYLQVNNICICMYQRF